MTDKQCHMPARRDFLASVGAAVALAGCSAQQETEPIGSSNETGDESTDSEPDPSNETSKEPPESESDPSNETSEESPEPEADLGLSVDSAEWYEEGFVAEFIVANQEDVAIRQLQLIVDWYNEEGEFLDWSFERIPALGAGKSWYVHVESPIDAPADSFEMFARGIPQASAIPDALEIQSSEVLESIPEVTGIISNTDSSEIGANVVATVYDNGWLTHAGSTTQSRIPPGSDWRFHVPIDPVAADFTSAGEEIELYVSSF
jgi:hypothetical protein